MTFHQLARPSLLSLCLSILTASTAWAEAFCLPPTPGANYVVSQEGGGGHLIDRHVGKSDKELAERLNAQPNIMAASTFLTLAVAEAAIQDAAKLAAGPINAWAVGAANKRRGSMTVALDRVIGRVAYRVPGDRGTEVVVAESRHVRLVMRRNGPGDCLLLTGYPALVLDADKAK